MGCDLFTPWRPAALGGRNGEAAGLRSPRGRRSTSTHDPSSVTGASTDHPALHLMPPDRLHASRSENLCARSSRGLDVTEQVFEDTPEGHVEESDEFLADRAEMVAYATASDPWPIHTDEGSARQTVFGGIHRPLRLRRVPLLPASVHTLPINQGSRGHASLGAVE